MSLSDVIGRLRGNATSALSTDKQGSVEVTIAKLYMRLFPKARFRIYRTLARLIETDIDGRTALEFIYDVLSNGGRDRGQFDAVAVSHWLSAYREHGRLSEALVGWVPQSEILLIEAGERSGKFQDALDIMIRLNGKLSSIRGAVVAKLAYPVFTGVMLAGALYFLSTDFMPTVAAVKGENAQWTGSAASTVTLLTWVRGGMIPAAIALVIAIGAVIATLPIFRGRVRAVFDKLPPWSLHRFTSGTSFLTAILVLMESGRGLVEALGLVRPNASPYLADKIRHVEKSMKEGEDFATALALNGDQFPDKELIKEIQIYNRIGRLDEGLVNVVEQWMDDATAKAVGQIAVAGMVVMGISFSILGFVLTGLYDIMGQIKQGY